MKISVDRDICEGYGTCAQIAPDLFELDEWGYATATGSGEVPLAAAQLARRAVLECPMNAIALEE